MRARVNEAGIVPVRSRGGVDRSFGALGRTLRARGENQKMGIVPINFVSYNKPLKKGGQYIVFFVISDDDENIILSPDIVR